MHGCYKEIAFSIFTLMLIFWAGSVHFKLLAILKANSCKTQSTVIMSRYAVDGHACGSTSSQQPLMECAFCLQSIEREKHPGCNCSLIWSQINRAVRHKGDSKTNICRKHRHYIKHTLKHIYFFGLTLACTHTLICTLFSYYIALLQSFSLISLDVLSSIILNKQLYTLGTHTHAHTATLSSYLRMNHGLILVTLAWGEMSSHSE